MSSSTWNDLRNDESRYDFLSVSRETCEWSRSEAVVLFVMHENEARSFR